MRQAQAMRTTDQEALAEIPARCVAMSATPMSANTTCAKLCSVVLTVMAATAAGAASPRWVSCRIMRSGPPIWPAGIRLLADSPIQRTRIASSIAPGRAALCSMRIAAASRIRGTRWNSVTPSSPKPASARMPKMTLRSCEASTSTNRRAPAARSQGAARVMASVRAARLALPPRASAAEYLAESEIRDRILHVGHEAAPAMHARIGEVFKRERDAPLACGQRRDTVAQCITVKEHQSARGDLKRARLRRTLRRARMQLIVEATAGFIDHPDQHRVAPARVVGGVVVPADVIAGLGIKVERIRVRIIGRRDLQRLPGHRAQPREQGR